MLGRLLSRRESPPVEARSWAMGQLTQPWGAGFPSSSGQFVTTEKALTHPTVWACAHRIARDVSRLPWDVYTKAGGARREVSPVPQIVAVPSVQVPASGWRYQVVMSLLLAGNAWGRVTETTADMRYPTRVELYHPDDIRVDRSNGLRIFAKGVELERWPVGPLWHMPAWLMPGDPIGLSVIGYHREAIASGLAVQGYANEFFGSGGHPSAIIYAKQALSEEQAKAIKASWSRATSGAREVGVMGADLEYKPIQSTPEDAQYVESQRWSAEEVCRVFGMPPELIGLSASGSSLTYANREDRALDYVTFTLADWMTRLEEALTALTRAPQFVKANEKALLRMSALVQAQVNEIGIRNGWRSVNEVRAFNDEPPVDGGDTYNVPAGPATPGVNDGQPSV
jgi:HK97 family phage portal protein